MLLSIICPKLEEFAMLKEMQFSLKKDPITEYLFLD